MSDSISKAKELGNAIIQSKEFTEYQRTKKILEDKHMLDEAALYERARMIVDSGRFDDENKLCIDAMEVIDRAIKTKELMDYFNAKEELSLLLKTVNGTLAHITGMDTGNSGCGGCSGCK